MFDYCQLKKRTCQHCVDDGKRFVCQHRQAKIGEDGFSLVSIQKICPMDKSKRRTVIIEKDKYGRILK